MRFLLDSSVLIALASRNHPHQNRCEFWFTGIEAFATCPITEGALVRFLVRLNESPSAIHSVLSHITVHDGHEFWADSISYIDTDLTQVMGHRQVTDAYLVELVRQHLGTKLATLDEQLAQTYPKQALLIP